MGVSYRITVQWILQQMQQKTTNKMKQNSFGSTVPPTMAFNLLRESVKEAIAQVLAEQERKEAESNRNNKIIFQLGTNNWQWSDEPSPGSGILHESHHNAYNTIEGAMSYSIYPSFQHKTEDIPNNNDDLIRIYTLDKNIPICESVAPTSTRRWHRIPQNEVDDYRINLEHMVYHYLIDIEKRHGSGSLYFCVAHHTFMNCIILRNVMKKREENKLSVIKCMVYIHGTGLKMYQNELNKLDEYPMKFYTMMNDLNIFNLKDKNAKCYFQYALSNSPKVIGQFMELFPKFEKDRCIVNYPGINQNIFKMIPDLTLSGVLKDLQLKALQISDDNKENKASVVKAKDAVGSNTQYDTLVTFIGKLADWKRPDYVMAASEIYDAHFKKENKNVLTLWFGGGPDKDKVDYLKRIKALNHNNFIYVGTQMQPVLAQLLNVSALGVFPSKKEPFGMVFIETMACGTPVIGAKSGGPIDFVTKDVGVLVEENEKDVMVEDIAKTIIRFVDDNAKSKMQKACLECANKFTVVEQQRRLLTTLEPLLYHA